MQLLGFQLSIGAVMVMVLAEQCVASPSPIVLVPGVMGSRLEVKDNGGPSKCDTFRKYEELWMEPLRVVFNTACAKRELPLLYDPTTNSFHNNTNVKIHVPGFGETYSVEYLNPTMVTNTISYMHDLVEYFVDRGYKRGKTIRAAPYDWRLAADELEKRGYYHQMRSLIEDMYESSDGTKVTLVGHSMGGPVSLYFLTAFSGIDQDWKDKYIHAYTTLSGTWAGAAAVLQTVVGGAHDIPDYLLFASDLINDFIVPVVRTFESIPWCLPKSTGVFGDTVLIDTPSKGYTANDYEELFSTIGYTNGYRFFQHGLTVNHNYPAPNVPTFCFHGIDVDTPRTFRYNKDFEVGKSVIGLRPSSITYGNGDGSVNLESSRVCRRWSRMPSKYPFAYKTFKGVKHQGMVSSDEVLDDIALVVGAIKEEDSILDTLRKWLG